MANKWLGSGRLTRDPEIRHTGDGKCHAKFTVASKRRMSRSDSDEKQDADFISCVAFGKTAEFAEKYLFKGKMVFVIGRLVTGSYVDRDGKTVYTTDVVVDDLEFLESKASEDAALNRANASSPAPIAQVRVQQAQPQQTQPQQTQPQQTVRPAAQPQTRVVAQNTTTDGFMTIPEDIVSELPWGQ